jgi:hypothetical protein
MYKRCQSTSEATTGELPRREDAESVTLPATGLRASEVMRPERADPEHFGSTRDRPKTVRYRASTGVHRCDVSSVLNRRVAALWSVGSAGNMRLLAWLNARTR